ncbi:MAG: phosphatidylinositol-specific phospholipase C [Pseudonocardiaceae bacterium]
MDEFISHSSWMRDIPDDVRVTTLSIPGTHDSCSVDGILGFGKTQNLDLADQLNAGIRFLDIRLAYYRDDLFVHHDVVHMGKCYADVLKICSSFLGQHPSEAIFMSIKNESRFDSNLGQFAPSQVFGKARGDRANWVVRSSSFEHAFQARTWQHVEDESFFYNLAIPRPNNGSETANPTLTSQTTMGEIRGKIVLLRRFEGGDHVGFDLTYWPRNRRFRSTQNLVYAVEDRYLGPGEGDKYKFIVEHMEEARRRDPRDLYITFSSAVNLKAIRYARAINPRLNYYLVGSSQGRVGIIVMDYFEEPRELVSNVIGMNRWIRRSAVIPSGRAAT